MFQGEDLMAEGSCFEAKNLSTDVGGISMQELLAARCSEHI